LDAGHFFINQPASCPREQPVIILTLFSREKEKEKKAAFGGCVVW